MHDFYKIDVRPQSKSGVERALFWLAVALVFFLCNFTPSHFARWNQGFLASLKGLLFLAGSIVLFREIWSEDGTNLLERLRVNSKGRLKIAAGLFAALALLAWPFTAPWGLSSMGIGYGLVSADPFAQAPSWSHRRLMFVAIPHWLGFRGPHLFYAFFLILVFVLIYLAVSFFEEKARTFKLDLNERPFFHFFCLLSLCTSSGILFHFQYVGYPEAALLALLFFVHLAPLKEYGFLAIVAGMMAVHEIAVFLLVPVLLFSAPARMRWKGIAVVALFFFFWALSFKLNLSGAISAQVQVDGRSGLGNLLHRPDLGVLGVFFAYKLLWLGFAFLLFALRRNKDLRGFLLANAAMIGAPLAMIVLTVDTSRLMGLGFLGAMAFLLCFLKKAESGAVWRKAGTVLLVSNFLLPSYYVGTTSGFQIPPGLYAKMPVYQFFKHVLGKRSSGRIF